MWHKTHGARPEAKPLGCRGSPTKARVSGLAHHPCSLSPASAPSLQGTDDGPVIKESCWEENALACQMDTEMAASGKGHSLLHCAGLVSMFSPHMEGRSPLHAPWIFKEAAAAAKSLQSCLNLCDSIDGSPPGSAVPGILQARTLERVAISFSNA